MEGEDKRRAKVGRHPGSSVRLGISRLKWPEPAGAFFSRSRPGNHARCTPESFSNLVSPQASRIRGDMDAENPPAASWHSSLPGTHGHDHRRAGEVRSEEHTSELQSPV